MATDLCQAGPGCMGCSFCEGQVSAYHRAEAQHKKDDEKRAQGKPTLSVTFGELISKKKK